MKNPWNIPEYTKLKHKKYGFEVTYEFDICYEDWFLWNGRSLMNLNNWKLDDFEIIK